ncbi:MAG: zf-HC2 domain-containing protein [Opitutus sp.]|nr:zf-HC2 domain-containing protein [Opitutus sp.]
MNCREAQHQIFAIDGRAPDESQRAAFESHVRQCADCRRIREDLSSGLTHWRTAAEKIAVPDADREWHTVRRRIRGGAEAPAKSPARPRQNLLLWLSLPLGAAAAVALGLFVSPRSSELGANGHRSTQTARADAVEVPGNNASTMVFVDDKSGWLFVWASDAAPKRG